MIHLKNFEKPVNNNDKCLFRLLVEFRTRKAHRWVVREKDLLKYWAVMITCVSVYLASGTISTLEHSEHSEHSIWKMWDYSGAPAVSGPPVIPTDPSSIMIDMAAYPSGSLLPGITSSSSRSTHPQLFPKSIKGIGESNSGRVGVRVRNDGPRSTNASFLLQKARVLRRGTALGGFIDPSQSIGAMSSNDDALLHPSVHSDRSHDNNNTNTVEATTLPEAVINDSTYANQSANNQTTNKSAADGPPCDLNVASDHGSNSLLYARFQVNSGSYFTVCRQLWWHYVNMAGKYLKKKLIFNKFEETQRRTHRQSYFKKI
jgi:hypothetical protein